jgi:hypothetical protein
MSVTVRVNLKNLKDAQAKVNAAAGSGGNIGGSLDAMFRQWSVRYFAFSRKRFADFSEGGGDWPALAQSTINARRKGKSTKAAQKASSLNREGGSAGGRVSILRDTGILARALTPGAPGSHVKRIPGGIKVGIGGGNHGGSLTIGWLARIHDQGLGHVPVRKIIAPPNDQTRRGMANDAKAAVLKIAQGGGT